VVLTFDDAFRSVRRNALPELARRRMRAIVYVVSGLVGGRNEWERAEGERAEPLMDEAELREWLAAGHAIGSHTVTHPFLTRLSEPAARDEIRDSRRALEDRFGVPVEHFCYPHGDWDARVRDLVIAAGYRSACTTLPGLIAPATAPHEIPRLLARAPSWGWRALAARWTAGAPRA
jgi:peptidoglycan/xylan/chitin deacetylase (PgdA/CDA1 family)